MRPLLHDTNIDNQALNAMSNFHSAVVDEVKSAIQANDVVVVGMKTNPVVTQARKMLNEKNITFKYIEHGSYVSKWKERLAIKLWSGWPTFPQVFYKGLLIGGAADLKKYIDAGKLK